MIKSLPLAIVVVVSTLGLRGAWASPAAIPEASEANMPDRVVLEIDHQALLEFQVADAAERVALFTREDTEKALREVHGVEIVDDPSVPALVVRLSWIHYMDSIYRVEIIARRPGHEPEIITSIERHFTNSTALSAWVAGNLSDVLAELGRPVEEEAVEADDGGGGGGEAPQPEESEVPEEPEEVDESQGEVEEPPSKMPLAAVGKAGIALMATGFVTVGVGIGVSSVGKTVDEEIGLPNGRSGRDYRRPGAAVLISGGVLMVGGAVLLVLDRRRGKGRDALGLRMAPTLGGLQLSGRF